MFSSVYIFLRNKYNLILKRNKNPQREREGRNIFIRIITARVIERERRGERERMKKERKGKREGKETVKEIKTEITVLPG